MATLLNKHYSVENNHYRLFQMLLFRILFKVLQIYPPLAAWVACRRFFRPRKYRPKTVKNMGAYDLQVESLTVRVYEGGVGPCVLVVHGWESSVANLQILLDRLISKHFRVITFDLPAHGHSSARDTDIIQITDIIMNLAEIYGPFAAVIGYSFGGACLGNAIRRKLKFAQLVLISTPSNLVGIVNKYCLMLGIRRPTKVRLIQAIIQRLDVVEIERDFDLRLILKIFVVPTLIMHDLQDRVVPFTEGKELSTVHDNIELFATERLGHGGIIRDAHSIDKCISFISENLQV